MKAPGGRRALHELTVDMSEPRQDADGLAILRFDRQLTFLPQQLRPEMDQTDLESLLATLRSAQGDAPPPPPAAVAPPPASLPPPPAQSDLDALLSTLTALPSVSPAHQEEYDPHLPLQRSRTRDVSALSFQEAMPVLNSLTMSNEWLDQVEGVWEEQKNWELRLKDERNRYEGELKRDGSA